MVSWVCPECGCECATSDLECPDCTDLVHAGMLELAEVVRKLPPLPDLPLQGLRPVLFSASFRTSEGLPARPAVFSPESWPDQQPIVPLRVAQTVKRAPGIVQEQVTITFVGRACASPLPPIATIAPEFAVCTSPVVPRVRGRLDRSPAEVQGHVPTPFEWRDVRPSANEAGPDNLEYIDIAPEPVEPASPVAPTIINGPDGTNETRQAMKMLETAEYPIPPYRGQELPTALYPTPELPTAFYPTPADTAAVMPPHAQAIDVQATVAESVEIVPATPPAQLATPTVKPRKGVPGWMMSVVVATTLSLIGGVLAHRYTSAQSAEAAPQMPSPSAAPASYLFTRYVEVTGLRVVVDLKHRSQLHYIVVNHSSTPLPNIRLRLAVHPATASAGSQPLFTVSSDVDALPAYASREIQTDINDLGPTAIPDWDNLKADVQVIAQ